MRIIQTFTVLGSLYLIQYIYLQEQQKECECSNERPTATPDYSCVQLAAWGKCDKTYLEGYCNASCQNCDCPCEDKLPNDGGANCEKRKEWGACEKAWMMEGFYCAKTCGYCSSETDAASKSVAVSNGIPKAPIASQTRSTTPATPFNPPTTQPNPTQTISPSWNSISTLLPSPTVPQTNLGNPTQDFALTPPRTPTLATSLVQIPTQLSTSQELPAPVVTPTPFTPTKLEGYHQLGTSAVPTPEPVNVAPITPSTVPINSTLSPTVVPVAPSLTPTLTPTPSIIPVDPIPTPTPSIIPADPTLAAAPTLTPTVTPLAATLTPTPVPLAPTLTPTVTPPAPALAPSTVPLGPTLIPGTPLTPGVVPTIPTLASGTVPIAQNPPVVISDTVVSPPDLVPQIPSVSSVTPTVAPTIPTPTPMPNVNGISAPVVNPTTDATVVSNPVIGDATALQGTTLNTDATFTPAVPVPPSQAAIPVENEIVPLVEEAPQAVSLNEIFGEDSYENKGYNFESIAAVDMYNQVISDALTQEQQVVAQQEEDLIGSAVEVDPTAPMSTVATSQDVMPEVVSAVTAVPQVVPTPVLPDPIIAVPITTTVPTPVTATGQCNTVYDIMSTDPDLSVSFEIWNRVRDMQSQGYDDPNIPFTVFVPVNAAWNNYTLERSTSLEELMNDTPLINRLVTFHELPEPTFSTEWKHGLNLRSELRDIYDKRIIVLVGMPEGLDGEVRLLAETQALVIERDINACAAVLMKLNDIMVPSGARLPPLPSAIN